MQIIPELNRIWNKNNKPFLIGENFEISMYELLNNDFSHLEIIMPGEVVALVGDFTPRTLSDLLHLIDKEVIIVPLTHETLNNHSYYFEISLVDWIVVEGKVTRRNHTGSNLLIDQLRLNRKSGIIFFSSGTTGRPKAILHDLELFLQRYFEPRPKLKTLAFLLFDHIGGINTFFHTIFNGGVIVTTYSRKVDEILMLCKTYSVEVLPTTPTFLRMMLISGYIPHEIPKTLKIITYGTERMDQHTLNELCSLLPDVDFRQTYGMSELGILRAKSEKRDSLFFRIGGKGVETRIINSVLHIKSENRMIGYLNSPSPFDADGWLDTGDQVQTKGDYVKIVGRTTEVINVGGLKFIASDVERIALEYPQIEFVQVRSHENPITGQHVEMLIQVINTLEFDMLKFKEFLLKNLPPHMHPRRIKIGNVNINHRFKKS